MVPVVQVSGAILNPVVILVISVIILVYLIARVQLPPFIALLLATIAVGVLSPQIPVGEVGTQTAEGFGQTMIGVGIPILMAAVIAKSLMESGAAERIVRFALTITGNGGISLLGSSYVLAIPVFQDNVYYLLAPLARQMRARVGGHLALYTVAIIAGSVVTHTFVPPTPGAIAVATELDIDLGIAILVGAVVALPASIIGGYLCGKLIDSRLEIPLRETMGTSEEDLEEILKTPTEDLPGIVESSSPILLAVVLIAANTIAGVVLPEGSAVLSITSFFGDPNIALTIAALIAAWTYFRLEIKERDVFENELTTALKNGGNIIAITAAGGAFGSMLATAGVGEFLTTTLSGIGIPLLFSAWLLSAVMIAATGSITTAMITSAGIVAPTVSQLTVHPVYLMMAIGSGSMVLIWYNASGFWLVKEIGGLTQKETLIMYTGVCAVMSVVSLVTVLIASTLIPLA